MAILLLVLMLQLLSSTSLINNLNIKQNGKVVYEGNSVFLTTYIKSLIEYSGDYARSIASGEYFM